jgi:predicted Ser/Thr protein kinase
MQLYAGAGNRSAALRQYQSCLQLLEDELGVPPEAETTALYERISADSRRHRKLIADTYAILDGDTPEGLEQNLLGRGGMGNVYRGVNSQTGEAVAIKVLKPEIVASDADLVTRFVREGQALRQLNHPNIVKMLAASEQDGQHYLVMEYVSGGSLHDLIAGAGPLPVSRVLEIALDLADALTRAHRLNIIHRDLKPPNVLLAADGTPRLTDFGLALQLDGPRTTQTGMIMGTVDYLSPEGCEGQPLDERADIWSFGVILFEMLSGERPFKGDSLLTTLTAILRQPRPDLDQYRHDIPAPLIDLIDRMLAKEPENRLPSVRLVGAELESMLAERPMTPVTPVAVPVGPPPACPYRGLFAFREEDASFFFGREAFTRYLVEAARARPLLAVIGSSGSGKSSVVYAGLLAHLRSEASWLIITFRPGSGPFEALAAQLIPYLEPDLSETDHLVETRKLAERLQAGELLLTQVVDRILEKTPGASRLLLVADQFEELFTLCPEPEVRYTFLDVLLELVDLQPFLTKRTFTLVFTLRADFLEQALTHRPLADALQEADIKLGPMTREELGRAIEQPAGQQGVTFESGLVERILDDVGEEPGNLPLLEFALTALWEQQQGRLLSHSGYEVIAHVEGALTGHADEVFAALSPAEQAAARHIFIQLVRPGEGTEDTRRLALRQELDEADWQLVQKLADARLVVTGRDAAGNETVEVVHEALIRSWGRLRQWMQADRTFRAWQERLRAALRQWETSGRDQGALLRGVPLAKAENWLGQRGPDLSQAERDFVEAGLAARRQREEAEQAQQERERALERSALRRLRVIVTVLVAASIVGITLTIIIFNQSQTNRQTAEQAQAASTAAIASQATAEAEQQVAAAEATADAERQVAIAAEATAVAERAEAERSELVVLSGHTGRVDEAVWSVDENRILTAGQDGTARVWEAETGTELLNLNHGDWVEQATWNADDGLILTASHDDTARVWDAETGAELLTLSGHTDDVSGAAWNADGSRILTYSKDGTVRVWAATTGAELLVLSGHTNRVNHANWNADESRILTASEDSTVRLWDAVTGAELAILSDHTSTVYQAIWNADESRILTSAYSGSRQYYTRLDDLIAVGCQRSTRNLTQAEWQQFMGEQPYRATCPTLPVPE